MKYKIQGVRPSSRFLQTNLTTFLVRTDFLLEQGNSVDLIYMCLNKAWGHTRICSAGEDEEKYRIYNKSFKLPDEEAKMLS